MLTIDLLRHGALVGGVKYRGALDDPLTCEGRLAMDDVWCQIKEDVTSVVYSPLSRCAEPAQAWAKEAGVSCVAEPAIQELSYGGWEGLTAEEIKQHYPQMLEKWRQDPTHMTPPQGEPMIDFSKRIRCFLQTLLAQHQPGHLLIVAHSGSIRMLIAHALQAPIVSTRHLSMPYACWSRLVVKEGQASLCFHAKDTAG